MAVLLGIGFVAGLITAISPCVLPVLPILFAGGVGGAGRTRPLLIVAGLIVSFTAFTLAGASLLNALGLPQDFLRNLAIGMLVLLAATLLVPKLGELLERPLLPLTRRRPTGGNAVLLGAGLGLVFVPCAGPVLAAMTALSATGQIGFETFAVTVAYAAGAALPMLAIAAGGQRLASGVKLMRTHAHRTRQVAGALLGVTALAIAFGWDTRFTTSIPGYTKAIQDRIERSSAARKQLRKLRGIEPAQAATTSAPRASDFKGISLWINTPDGKPLSLVKLRGKVVLVDFWTYSCINCLRTLPHLKAWDAAYRKDGLVIVGVHTPEFAFERVHSNVKGAVLKFGLRYPVAVDNSYDTWNAYQNEFWPAKYLIDKQGVVRYTHFGEGEYGETEATIRRLLGEPVKRRPTTSVPDRTPTQITTPELYLGYGRIANYAGSQIVPDREIEYRFPPGLARNELAYAGRWRVELERIVAGEGARLRLNYVARFVHLVLSGTGRVQVLVDGKLVQTVRVSGLPRLHTLVEHERLKGGLLELRFTPGVAGYAFTFG